MLECKPFAGCSNDLIVAAVVCSSCTHLVHHLFGLSVADAEASGLVVGAV